MNKFDWKINLEIERAKIINEYDYNEMLDHFKSLERIEKIKNLKNLKILKIKNRWEEKMKKISHIKNCNQIEKSISINISQTGKSNLPEIKQTCDKQNINKISTITLNNHIQHKKIREENERMEFQKKIEYKLRAIKEKNQSNKEKIKMKFKNKFKEDFYKYKIKLKEIEDERIEKLKEKEKVEIKKLNNFKSFLNNQKHKIQERVLKDFIKHEKISGNLEEKEKLLSEKRKEQFDKINENRAKEKSKILKLRLKPLKEKVERNKSRFLNRLDTIIERRQRRDRNLLNKESILIKKTKLKEKQEHKNRIGHYERIINTQIEYDEKNNQMYLILNQIMSENVKSMSENDRKEYYEDLKRKEEEERQKLIEEKKKN